MPEPWEMTDDEAALEAEQLRERHAAADRIAAPLFVRQMAANPTLRDRIRVADVAHSQRESSETEFPKWLQQRQADPPDDDSDFHIKEAAMPKEIRRRLPSELTDEEAKAEGERLREELRAADRIAAPLFVRQLDEEDERLRELGANKYGELLEPFPKASDDSARRQRALLVGGVKPKRRPSKK